MKITILQFAHLWVGWALWSTSAHLGWPHSDICRRVEGATLGEARLAQFAGLKPASLPLPLTLLNSPGLARTCFSGAMTETERVWKCMATLRGHLEITSH